MLGFPYRLLDELLVHVSSLLLVSLILTGFCIWRLLKQTDETTAVIPPGARGLPFIGESAQFIAAINSNKGIYNFVHARRLRYGNCFKSSILGKTHVFISGTESVRAVLSNDFSIFSKRYMRSIAQLIGDESILCASVEQHRLLRNLLTNFFTTQSASASIRYLDELTKKTLANWNQRGSVIVLEDTLKITFDAMCNLLMSLEDSNETAMLQKDVARVYEAMLAFPMNLPWTTFSKGLKARKRIMHTLGKIIEQRRQAIQRHKKVDLLQFLLKEENSSDSSVLLTDKQIQENILTLIIAGQETTSNAITWMVKYLDENQEVQETLRDEQIKLEEKLRAYEFLTMEALNEMSYASQMVKESLRMASIVPWFPRVALKDCEVEGFKIKKGWIINIDARAVHLDPSVYKDPTRFCPGRFDECSKPYSFLAFGAGARMCLGMNLSRAMMLVFLHRFITTYRWEVMDSDSDLEKMALFSRLRSGCPVCVVPLAHKSLSNVHQ